MHRYLTLGCLWLAACGEVDADLEHGAGAHGGEQNAEVSGPAGAGGQDGAGAHGGEQNAEVSGPAGAGGQGGGQAGVAGESSVALTDSAWNVSLETTLVSVDLWPELVTQYLDCPRISMTLHVTRKNAELHAVLGGPGTAIPGRLTESEQEYTNLEPMDAPHDSSCNMMYPRLEALAFRAIDVDGDGSADRLAGSGTGHGDVLPNGSDIMSRVQFSFALSGTPDETPPTWVDRGELDPLNVLGVSTSEPVTVSDTVVLEGEPRIELLPRMDVNGVVASFGSEVILPFGKEWALTGKGRDLAGLPLANRTVRSLPDPGIFAEDGFEGESFNARIQGTSAVVSAVGDVPALSGEKSLLLDPKVPVTFHLARPEGASRVRFLARSLLQYESQHEGFIASVGVIGGVRRATEWEVVEIEPARATGASTWKHAGPLREYSYALEEEGRDVALKLWTFVSEPSGIGPQALLVDDVRVE